METVMHAHEGVEYDTLDVESGNFEQIPHWILFHPEVTPNGIRLYLVLRSYAMGKGTAFPSRRSLAAKMNVSVPTLDAAKKNLVSIGAIEVEERHSPAGDRTTNLYRVKWQESSQGGKENMATPPKDLGHPLPRNLGIEAYELQADQVKPHERDISRPAENPGGENRREIRKPVNPDPGFEAFWQTYPRKTAKGSARAAWSKAIRKADPETIITSAAMFAADPNREDEFTPHAATWLNQERWEDGPLPAKRGSKVNEYRRVQEWAAQMDDGQLGIEA